MHLRFHEFFSYINTTVFQRAVQEITPLHIEWLMEPAKLSTLACGIKVHTLLFILKKIPSNTALFGTYTITDYGRPMKHFFH